jgi:DNA-binding response OmpR family regulator
MPARRSAKGAAQIVLLDIGLPGMSGYDVAREIRASSWGCQVYIVALTGWGSEDDRLRSKQVGIQRHLVKPVNLEALMGLISEIRGKHQSRGESRLESDGAHV